MRVLQSASMCTRYLGAVSVLLVLATGASVRATPPDGSGRPRDVIQTSCLSDAEHQQLEEVLSRYSGNGGRGLGAEHGECGEPVPKYAFYPVGGTIWRDLFINNFNDLHAGPGIDDFDCHGWTYNGHDATDTDIRSFGEQAIGVPVFAAMDGIVIAAHDGEDDMNTQPPYSPANYCIIDHGNGRIANYFHFKKDSVLVASGDHVVAGQQLALVGSSGSSTNPHLHFATYDNGQRHEPFSGPCCDESDACHADESGWYDQAVMERDFELRLLDCGLSNEHILQVPLWPHPFPQTGHFAFEESYRHLWILAANYPAKPMITLRLIRPDGTLAIETQQPTASLERRRDWHFWPLPFHPDLQTIVGQWHIELEVNGQLLVAAPFDVLPTRDPNYNRPPEPVTIELDPQAPKHGEVVFCRVNTSLTLDDLDYDIVRYEYVWTVDGQEVRRITSAGHADAIPRTFAQPGALIACAVTPMDEVSAGPTVNVEVVVDTETFDCNGNFRDDAVDIVSGESFDGNLDGIPDECQADVLFVKADAEGLGFGIDWPDAYTDLQTALRVARANPLGSPTQIWVAAGTYRPDGGCGDRLRSFTLIDGLEILGGFDGTEEDASERNPAVNITTLSGDLMGDDGPNFSFREDNSLHVVWAGAVSSSAVLDGFEIRGGNANERNSADPRGGGAWIEYGAPTFANCVFVDNRCDDDGGAIFNLSSSPTIRSCIFSGNTAADKGGAINNLSAAPTIVDCTFTGNNAQTWAGAIYNRLSSPMIRGSVFQGNHSDRGGAVYDLQSDSVITGSVFEGNQAYGFGGALFANAGSSVIQDCSFIASTADSLGGAVFLNNESTPLIINCTFQSNRVVNAGGDGGAMALNNGHPLAINCLFASNSTGPPTGGSAAGGAIYANGASNAEFVNCTWFGNDSSDDIGGAIFVRNTSVVNLFNCIVWGNTPNAFWENTGEEGVVHADYSVVQGGWPGQGNIDTDPLFVDVDGPDNDPDTWEDNDYRLQAQSPCIDAGDNTAIPADVTDLDDDGDIDEPIPFDLDYNPRFVDDPDAEDCPQAPGICGPCPVVDMGTYERREGTVECCPADFNGDGTVGPFDLATVLGNWGPCEDCPADLDGDGSVGPADLAQLLGAWGPCP